MFDSSATEAGAPSSADLVAFAGALRELDTELDDAARFERIRRLEELQAAAAAAQVLEVAAFVSSHRAVTAERIAATVVEGVGTRRRLAAAERGIVADVALARRESPAQAARFIAFATSAPTELPHAFGLLAAGRVSARRVLTVHRETVWLSGEHRRRVDAELAPDLPTLGDRQVQTRAQTAAQRIDPEGACARAAAAERDRHVSVRPAPEAMLRFNALLPLVDGVAVYACLDRAAASARAAGDDRGRGAVMADTLVELVTGRSVATGPDIRIDLVMTDQSLLGESDEPARILGHGTVPARLARVLALHAGRPGDGAAPGGTPAARSVRRLFTDPAGGLVAMESTTRAFGPAMREFVRLRDDVCRTPWCDAPIRHIDHVDPAARGGPTRVINARGYCERCNYTAQSPGMTSRAHPVDGSIATRTPTGQTYRTTPPGLPHEPLHTAPVFDVVWTPGASHAA